MANSTAYTKGFTAVFTRVPEGDLRAAAAREFMLEFAGVAPPELRWRSGAPVDRPSISDSMWGRLQGITYDPGRRDPIDRLSIQVVRRDREGAQDYMEVRQDLGLSYNNS